MTFGELLRWQWEGYPRYHRTRQNLLLHIIVVPLFWLGTLLLVQGLRHPFWTLMLTGLVLMAVSLVAQGLGHRIEPNPPEPFTSRGQAIARLLSEQWITFPRFVFSGGWARAWQGATW
jgi:amino acid permease